MYSAIRWVIEPPRGKGNQVGLFALVPDNMEPKTNLFLSSPFLFFPPFFFFPFLTWISNLSSVSLLSLGDHSHNPLTHGCPFSLWTPGRALEGPHLHILPRRGGSASHCGGRPSRWMWSIGGHFRRELSIRRSQYSGELLIYQPWRRVKFTELPTFPARE